MKITEEAYLEHYGTPRHSGRYPWGSGGEDNHAEKRNKEFLDYVADLKRKGMSETDIAAGQGMTTTQLRAAKSIAKNNQKQADINRAQRLHDHGYSNVEVGRRMGINESSVRSLLQPGQKDKADVLQTTASMLKDQVDQKKYLDVGSGVENHIGISRTKLDTALAVLKEQGYQVHSVKVQQQGTGKFTELKVLVPPGVSQKEAWQNRANIKTTENFTEDGGRSYFEVHPPLSVSSKRIGVNYKEDGGATRDGLIYVRPGVKDVSLGNSQYAQVRIQVDGTHYLKGMAVYKENLPEGQDLVFNTNKSDTGSKLDAMKPLKRDSSGAVDADLPFGSVVRQIPGSDGKPSSAMNIVNEDADWDKWSRSLSSQFLSKQSPALAKTQLDMTYEKKQNEFDQIMALTNPAVRKKLLESFADGVDSSAVHLKAAALPGQATKVILPINSMKENEVYAPTLKNGDHVVLVRFPHGGKFEIPELTVNNKNQEAKAVLGNAENAIGIHHSVAARLSGADFDGDTVLVIPNSKGRIKSAPALESLKGFDPQTFKNPADIPFKGNTQQLMGSISNLITDMTIRGASTDELARAVRHSMVVIDAEKHGLNHQLSAEVNGIAALKTKYQSESKSGKGASTIISRKKSESRVPERKDVVRVDPTTGKKIYTETGATYIDRNGKLVKKMSVVNKLSETEDANTLSSGTPIEKLYADHSNRLKALANKSRLAALNTKPTPQSPTSKKVYDPEVKSLEAKLNVAKMNRPRERQAQLLAEAQVSAKRQANPNLSASDVKKLKGQALEVARKRTGAGKQRIDITDKEWEAIQAGAVSNTKLEEILKNSDLDRVKQLATPKTQVLMTPTKTARAKAMAVSGYTQAEIAETLGVSLTTLKRSVED